MTIWHKGVFGAVAVAGGVLLSGCTIAPDDAGRFREAVPTGESVALRVPGASGAASTSQGLRIQSPTKASATSDARFYTFTRDLTRAVDRTTGEILGMVWTLANLTPTTVEAKKATWGPASSTGLEPNEWRFVVTEVATGEYDYTLEGRAKAGGQFRAILTGKGYGKAHASHETGWFQVDADAYRALEPGETDDEGTTKITYDLAHAPSTIAVELRPPTEKGFIDVKVTHASAGAGQVDIRALTDVEGSQSSQLEDVTVASRWDGSGAGRADVVMEKGDLPMRVTATECWSASFSQVFYEDTVSSQPKVGDVSSCAFTAP